MNSAGPYNDNMSNTHNSALLQANQYNQKFMQRKIKISSQGLFFNNKEMEKKANTLADTKVNFFRPFNSAFERNVHTHNK